MPFELVRWTLAEWYHWTLEEVDAPSLADLEEFFQVQDGRSKAANTLQRPEIFGTLNAFFIPAGTFILLVSIGMAMRFSSVGNYARECAAIAGIKFFFLPAIACLVGYLFGFGAMHSGLPLKVVLILSSAPVAFTALIPPSIYDLDLDLFNACWLTSTLALFGVLPILYVLIQHL